MQLKDVQIKKAQPEPGKPFAKLRDGRGMYLLVNSAGKYWRFDYRHGGTRKTLALGVYPDVSLRDARERLDVARKQLAAGIDPGAAKKAVKLAQAGADTFESVAREWHAKFSPAWVASHSDRILKRLETDVFPWIGKRAINEIKAPELLSCVRRVESRGALETAHRVLQNCGQVFRYAVATGRAERDSAADLRGALPPTQEKHHASITDPREVGALLRAIDNYQGFFVTKCALRFAPLVFVRPGELRSATWDEIDLDKAEWRIPAHRMKMRELHIVPLSAQAKALLEELVPLTGRGVPAKPDVPRYIFPGGRSRERPMSNNAVLSALRRMGYAKDEMSGHGFRSMASTLLHEQGWNHQAIERQLAHAERNAVSAAYNYTEHLPERRKMMQAWADYLDGLKRGAEVIPLRRAS